MTVTGARGFDPASAEETAGWQQQKSAATRTLILEATVRCLVESGYARTTTHAIAAKAGLSRGALLHHFPAKAEVLLATVEHVRSARLAALRRALAPLERGDADPVRRSLEAARAAARDGASIAARELAVAARTDPALTAVVLAAETAFAHDWREAVRAACGAAAFPSGDASLELARLALDGLAASPGGDAPADGAESALRALESLVRGGPR